MSQLGFNRSSNTLPKVSVPIDEFKHALFIGKTGNGKTTGGINPVMDSRIAAGYGMLVFDEKGKEHRVVKSIADRHGRLCDVVELGKPHGIRVNLLSRLSERQMESFIRRLLKRSNDSYWTESSVNMVMALVRWLVAIKKLHAFGVEKFGMERAEPLKILAQDVLTSVEQIGWPRDQQNFVPHRLADDLFVVRRPGKDGDAPLERVEFAHAFRAADAGRWAVRSARWGHGRRRRACR